MLDTDDTLVMIHEDSQVPYSDAVIPESPRSLPVKRQLFTDGEEVDLCTPAPKRMVARPLAKLKHMLAESAEAMRASRPSSSSGKGPSPTGSSDSLEVTSTTPCSDSIDEGNPGFITRREQLKLQPKARAKVRAGDKAVAAKSETKPKEKVPDAATAKSDPKELVMNEDVADPMAKAAAKPKAPSKKRKSAPKEATEAMAEGPGVDPGAEQACAAARSRRKTLHSKSTKNMTVNEVMPLLLEDDLKMRIVIDLVNSMGKPAITNKTELPEYKYWQLSTYWTRPSVGVIRKVGDERPVYVGTLTSGGWPTVNVALEAVDHFVAGPFKVIW